MTNKFTYFLLLFFFNVFLSFGQKEVVIVGQITDNEDFSPIPNASVYFENSSIGTITNETGFFVLRTDYSYDRIIVSMMGYKTKSIKIKPGRSQAVNVQLQEDNKMLPDIYVYPGINPADELMRKVRNAVHLNNPSHFINYQPLVYGQIQAAVTHIDKRSFQKKLFKELQKGVLSDLDSNLYLPIFESKESFSLFQGKKIPIKNETKSILLSENKAIHELANKLPVETNFYNNYISVFGKNFISPIATNSINKYRYYIKDSVITQQGKEYIVYFKPNFRRSLAFEGTMQIDSSTYAITKINAKIPQTTNINFINELALIQTFQYYKNKWVFDKQQTVVSLYLNKKDPTPGSFYIIKHNHYQLSKNDSNEFMLSTPKTEEFSRAIDSLKETRPIKTLDATADIIINKYLHAGYLDIGPLPFFVSANKIEGHRFTLGGRTGKNLSKNFTFGGYLGYGTSDDKLKYGGEIQYRFKKDTYTVIGAKYDQNMYQTDFNYHDHIHHENYIGNGLAGIFSLLQPRILDYHQQNKIEWFFKKEWIKGFNTTFSITSNEHIPNTYIPFVSKNITNNYLKDFNLTLDLRFSFKERILDQFFHRIYLSNFFPVTHFVIQGGEFQTENTNGQYLKLHTYTKQNLLLGNIGKLKYAIEAGAIFGNVPYPLLELYNAYENNGVSRYAFHPNSFYTYAADNYVNLESTIITNGIIFNHIPLINRLNFREMIGIKIAYGSLNQNNINLMSLPSNIKAFDQPYIQLSAGISNIFKILAIEYVWSFPQIKIPNSSNWGIQTKLYVDF